MRGGTGEPFFLAETAETGAENAEFNVKASLEIVFVSALSAPVSAVSARTPSAHSLHGTTTIVRPIFHPLIHDKDPGH
jgi:hypothetical protein